MVEEGSRGRKKDGGGDTRLMYREPIRLYFVKGIVNKKTPGAVGREEVCKQRERVGV